MKNTLKVQKMNAEACAWIAKLHGDALSDKDHAELREWAAQSAGHLAELRKLAKLWGELDVLTELAVHDTVPVKTKWRPFRLRPLLTGMGAIGVMALLLVAVLFDNSSSQSLASGQRLTYSTEIGGQRLVSLDDGSTALLNTNSVLTVEYTAEARNLYLIQGEAHFTVTSNPIRPFNVHAKNILVRAVGTAFSVHLKTEAVDVAVTEGSVELNAIDAAVIKTVGIQTIPEASLDRLAILKSGQVAQIDQIESAIDLIETTGEVELSRKLSWQEGLLQFSGEPLHEVIAEISRYTELSIVIDDPAIRDLRIGGLFEIGETGKMFQALETSFGVRVQRFADDTVYLSAAEKTWKTP